MQSTKKLFLAALLRIGLGFPLIAAIIMLPAGRWDYWQAWMYLATLFIPLVFVFAYLLKNDPALLERRLRTKEQEATQQKVVAASLVYFLVVFSLPGLDVRFGWSQVPPLVSVLGDALVLSGYLIFVWVLRVNSYLSRVVEVSQDQKVVSTGPYALVRHPMYAGISLLYLASPLALGSYWALLPALLILPLLAVRIQNEEQVLLRDLPGYAEYQQSVKYRLLPGVW